jgi:hypothetical protein
MNGAQGGMITADNRDLTKVRDPLKGYWEGKGTWEECLRIGHLMAAEAQRIVMSAPVQIDPRLVGIAKSIEINVRDAVSGENPFACLQMPPEVRVEQRKAKRKKRPDQK